MSVTPTGMLSWLQPDSARAAAGQPAATAARVRGASFARIIFLTCLTAHAPFTGARNSTESKSAPPSARSGALRPGGRLVDAADQALQPKRQSTSLLFRKKAAQLALAPVRLDGEPARELSDCGAAQFNLRPMPREHDPGVVLARTGLDAHVGLGDRDGLPVEAPLKAHLQRPAEEGHFEPRERQDRPETLRREHRGDAEGRHAGEGEK